MVANKGISLPEILKWAVIALMLYSIWKCVKADTENFRGGGGGGGGDISEEDVHETFVPSPSASGTAAPSEPTCGGATAEQPTCGGKGKMGGCVSATGSKLLPVLDPCFNMREICKQCVLLEDHLFQNEKRCTDCIKKHFLTIEGLAEEAITLDKKNEYHLSKEELPEKVRKLQKKFLNGTDPESIAQELRWIRKPLMAKFFDKF